MRYDILGIHRTIIEDNCDGTCEVTRELSAKNGETITYVIPRAKVDFQIKEIIENYSSPSEEVGQLYIGR